MPTTPRDASVTAPIAPLARELVELTLRPRQAFLRGRAPKSRYIHQLRRDMAAGRKLPYEHILIVGRSDLECGVPVEAVNEPFFRIIDENNAFAEQLRSTPAVLPDPIALIERQNAIQHRGDHAEIRLARNPDSIEAINERLHISVESIDAERRIQSGLRARLVRLIGGMRKIAAAL